MNETDKNSDELCPECGGPKVDGMTCWEQLGAIGAWEFQDQELYAEHFLTVACFNLQHPAQFRDEAIVDLRSAFIDRIEHGTPVEEIRRRMSGSYEGKRRVLKDEAERKPGSRSWSMTISDVYIADKPQGAAERVRKWAANIRNEV